MNRDIECIINNRRQIEALESEGDFSNKLYSLKEETNYLIQTNN